MTNGSFLDANNMDGLRKCLPAEYSHLYVFNLRGNARTQGEDRRKEAGGIFGEGSRTPVLISIMVKDPAHSGRCKLHYHDIGDYLSREEKLEIIEEFGSIASIEWQHLHPNDSGDWINQRDPAFDKFMSLGDKESDANQSIFSVFSLGVSTNRDAWVYNLGRDALSSNMRNMIANYNHQVDIYAKACKGLAKDQWPKILDIVETDPKKISWSSSLLPDAARGRKAKFSQDAIIKSMYRPYSKQWLYFDGMLNDRQGKSPLFFPSPKHKNVVIFATGIGASKPFSAVVADCVPNLHLHDTGQCFPLYWYEKLNDSAKPQDEMFAAAGKPDADGYIRRDAITDWALEQFRQHYRDPSIGKDDIFCYVYGILHSPEYKQRFASDLKKMLPRIPFSKDFRAFSDAGRKLGDLHLNYETTEPFLLTEEKKGLDIDPASFYRVAKMVFGKKDGKPDKSVIVYNENLALRDIPLEAYEYVVNGKPAIEWLMERYQVTVDKASGIKNDPNDWCTEHSNPRYIVDLVKRIVRVSVESARAVKALPAI